MGACTMINSFLLELAFNLCRKMHEATKMPYYLHISVQSIGEALEPNCPKR